jgi:hypothetical protein
MDRQYVVEVIGWLGRLTESSYAVFRDDVLGDEAFQSERERIEPLSITVGHDPMCVRVAVEVLGRLYANVHDSANGRVDAFVEDLMSACGPAAVFVEGAEGRGRAGRRLAELLAHRASADLQRARGRAVRGFSACAREFETILDLRPVHAPDGVGIAEMVPIVQLRIHALSEDPSERGRAYHLDRVALRRLRDAVAAAERQMDVVAASPGIGALVHGSPLRRTALGKPGSRPDP